MLKGVAALRAEEVAIMPVLAERNHVFTQDRCLAVLAARGELLVPVQVAVEAEAVVAVFLGGFAGDFFENFTGFAAADAVHAGVAHRVGLGADFHGFEACAAREAAEALRVEALGDAGEGDEAAFDGEAAFVAERASSARDGWAEGEVAAGGFGETNLRFAVRCGW